MKNKYSEYLNVDFLKKTAEQEPIWFGLGFIQLKLNDRLRMHFWHPKLVKDTPAEEIHNHRYNFTSHILRGEITNECWKFREYENTLVAPHCLVEVSCRPGDSGNEKIISRGESNLISRHTMTQGSSYDMDANMFHRINADYAVTMLERESVLRDTASVIRHNNSKAVCPFSKKIPVEKLWEYIKQCCQGFSTGYHTNDITKGVVGESSKIYEEILELQDAENQGNKIMADCELADIYGAMEMYLEKQRPHLSMDDLRVMAAATRGAFENGGR